MALQVRYNNRARALARAINNFPYQALKYLSFMNDKRCNPISTNISVIIEDNCVNE
jgi:hypothetical protein